MSVQPLCNPTHTEECPLVGATHTSPDLLNSNSEDFFLEVMVTATVLFLIQTKHKETARATLQSCEMSHIPHRALMRGARKLTHVFVFRSAGKLLSDLQVKVLLSFHL